MTYQDLCDRALPYHNARIDELRATYRLGQYERFDLDQDTGILTFSDAGVPKLFAHVHMLGSHSSVSETWLWSWRNASIVPSLSAAALRVREYGVAHRIAELVEPKFSASEDESWHLAACGGFILGAAGVYRCPVRIGSTFVAMQSISWAA